MNYVFTSGERSYVVSLSSDQVTLSEKSKSESLTMSRDDFKNFLEWMLKEMERVESPPISETQEIDVWDIV